MRERPTRLIYGRVGRWARAAGSAGSGPGRTAEVTWEARTVTLDVLPGNEPADAAPLLTGSAATVGLGARTHVVAVIATGGTPPAAKAAYRHRLGFTASGGSRQDLLGAWRDAGARPGGLRAGRSPGRAVSGPGGPPYGGCRPTSRCRWGWAGTTSPGVERRHRRHRGRRTAVDQSDSWFLRPAGVAAGCAGTGPACQQVLEDAEDPAPPSGFGPSHRRARKAQAAATGLAWWRQPHRYGLRGPHATSRFGSGRVPSIFAVRPAVRSSGGSARHGPARRVRPLLHEVARQPRQNLCDRLGCRPARGLPTPRTANRPPPLPITAETSSREHSRDQRSSNSAVRFKKTAPRGSC
jgi:hypothetical protein